MFMGTAVLATGALCAATVPATAHGQSEGTSGHALVIQRTAAAVDADHGGPVSRKDAPGELADAGSDSDTMLYAGLAIALCALGALAVAAARSRRH